MPTRKPAAAVQLTLDGARSGKAASAARKTATRKAAPRKPASGRPKAANARSARSPGGSASLEDAVRELARVAESLHFVHESFAEALLRLPRAEDYEPLTGPMERLAAAAPQLVRLLGSEARVAEAPAFPDPAPEARAALAAARTHLEAALASLPGPADYEPAARNLRELASVSPSLLAWLGEVPALSAPLAESVAGLRAALQEIDRALALLPDDPALATVAPSRSRGDASRVKVVVRG